MKESKNSKKLGTHLINEASCGASTCDREADLGVLLLLHVCALSYPYTLLRRSIVMGRMDDEEGQVLVVEVTAKASVLVGYQYGMEE